MMNYKLALILFLMCIGNVVFSEDRFRSIGETNVPCTFIGGIAYLDGEFLGYAQVPITTYDNWLRFNMGTMYREDESVIPEISITITSDRFFNLCKYFTAEFGLFIPIDNNTIKISSESIGIMVGLLKYNF